MNENKTIQALKQLFDSLGRGVSGRLIVEQHEEEKMRDIIEALFAEELRKMP